MFLPTTLLHILLLLPVVPSSCTWHPFKRDGTPYPIIPLHFIGALKPGGSKISLNGTAQEIASELRRLNPNYDEDFKTELATLSQRAERLEYLARTATLRANATAEDFDDDDEIVSVEHGLVDAAEDVVADEEKPMAIYADVYDSIDCWRKHEWGAKVKDTLENIHDLVKIVGLCGASRQHHVLLRVQETVELQVDPWMIYYNVCRGLVDCPWWDRGSKKDTKNVNDWVDFEAEGTRLGWSVMVCEELLGC